jgi:hypothetical protein
VREEKPETFAWAWEQGRLVSPQIARISTSRVSLSCRRDPRNPRLGIIVKADGISKSSSFEMITDWSGVDQAEVSVVVDGTVEDMLCAFFCRGVLQESIRIVLPDYDGQTRQDWELPPQWLVEGQVLTKAEDISTSSSFEMIDLVELALDLEGRLAADCRCWRDFGSLGSLTLVCVLTSRLSTC